MSAAPDVTGAAPELGGAAPDVTGAASELTGVLDQLRGGRIVAAATETWFGLLVDPFHAEALGCLFEAKGRDAHKASALLMADRAAWGEVVSTIPDVAHRLAEVFWPGPLTIALPARAGLDPRIVQVGTVAVRVPGASAAQQITAAWGRVLTATSANPTGAPPCARAEEVRHHFREAEAAGRVRIVPGTAPGGAPSTIVGVEKDHRVRVLRAGAIDVPRLAGALAGYGCLVEG